MIDAPDKQRQGLDPSLKAIVDRQEEKARGFVYCATCSTVIANVSDRIEVNGRFDHHFTNPYGIAFHVGCFAEALGCALAGERNAADTWFAGHHWRYASCSECQRHLGWYFDSADTHFYGLILDRIQHD